MSLLNNINAPADLRLLKTNQLPLLCDELRSFLIDTVSKTGGHFAANLGTVELAVALHYVFNTPDDKLVWDVGHQAYPHKILTDRKQLFDTLRKFNGLSGFPKVSESVYDAFGTGHSSTSISAVCGMAAAAQLNGEPHRHVAIIGDGALSAGQAFEGLNNLGFLKLPVLVILNDNHMGIDPVAGALSEYLNQIHLDSPNFFENLGFEYIGANNGHNVEELVMSLMLLKNLNKPTLFHVKTVKGKGFKPAEAEQTKWHATTGFDKINPLYKESIKNDAKTPKYQDVAGLKMVELAKLNPRIVAITPAMISGSSLHFMQNEMPQRVFDVGIAEQHAVTFAAGLAIAGAKPFCFIYSTFLQRAMDQVIHDVCLQELPVVFCIDRAGVVGEDGPTHHGMFDVASLNAIPNTVICAPACASELENMMDFAANFDKLPVFIRYPRGNAHQLFYPHSPIQLGKATLLQNGKDIALLSFGDRLADVLKVAELLSLQNLNPTVVDMRFLKPLDEKLLHELSDTHGLFCCFENAASIGGFGASVAAFVATENMPCKLLNFAFNDTFVPHGSIDKLMEVFKLTPELMAQKIVKFVNVT